MLLSHVKAYHFSTLFIGEDTKTAVTQQLCIVVAYIPKVYHFKDTVAPCKQIGITCIKISCTFAAGLPQTDDISFL